MIQDQPTRLGCNTGEGDMRSYGDASEVQDNEGHGMNIRMNPDHARVSSLKFYNTAHLRFQPPQ